MTDKFLLPESLLSPEFQRDAWQKKFIIWRGAVDPGNFISSREILDQLEASLTRWPYFTLLKDGQQPPMESYTVARNVIGQPRPGYADTAAIASAMAAGASLKLNQVGDWHLPTRGIRQQLEESFPVAASSYIFWTPQEQQGMLPHRDAAHVVAVQLEGFKTWELYADNDQIRADAGLDVDAKEATESFTLGPGDVLYLPHGWPHAARAIGGPSMHLTFTLAEPSAEDLISSLADAFDAEASDLVHGFHRLGLAERADAVQEALKEILASIDEENWAALALANMRKEVG